MYYFVTLLLAFNLTLHPLHLSVTNIEFQKEQEVFRLSFKIFVDDLENIMVHKHGQPFNIEKPGEVRETDLVVRQYLASHFSITLNENTYTPKDMKMLKREVKMDPSQEKVLWIYYQLPQKKVVEKASVKNSILQDLFYDQKNLVFFRYKDVDKAYKLDRRNPSEEIKIE